MAPPQVNRLRDKGLVDRKKVVGFNFDGTRLTGHPGDTLASALLANGVRLVARSFKYPPSARHSHGWLRGAERACRIAHECAP